ncbi:hypothetical protein RZS08_39730, partial [Arthrospira platensis SPKY1]|nr:hypothetical protein [Arthrospira platensis SPKY1]
QSRAFIDQAGLADTGVAAHQHHLAAASLAAGFQDAGELPERRSPADEGRLLEARFRAQVLEPPNARRLRRWKRLGHGFFPQAGVDGVGHQDLRRTGPDAQGVRRLHGVARHQVTARVAGGPLTDQHRT